MADDNDLDILAWTMLGEAAGEGAQGMADVGHVVLNRLNNGGYGSSISQVAQANKQFSTWNSGAGGNDPKGRYPKSSPEFQRARQLAEQVVAGTIQGPPGRPLDYHAPSVSPYWASSKDQNGTYTRNGHVFYPTMPVPKGEVPNAVGSLTDTIPRIPPTPVTPSIDMAQMRRISAPSQLIPETMARVTRPSRNLGDELAMSPIMGGKQDQPMFDAAYDTRVGQMRMTRQPMQGINVGASRPPAPVPAVASGALNARRLYAEGGPTRPPMDQVGIAPTGRPMLDNGDGSVSTELSITITDPRVNGGKPTNIPTIWGGRRLNDDMAINTALASGQKFQAFPSIAAAERAAVFRSENEILPSRVASAPVPAMPSAQLAARRATDPTLQAALNARYPAQLPPLPPSTRMVATNTVRPSASDLVRGNPMQTLQQETLIASIPTRPQVSVSDLARGRSGISTVASIPTTGFPTTAQILAGTGFRGGMPPAVPDRLMASSPYPPALYGEGVVAGIGGNAVAPVPFMRPPQFSAPGRVAPAPMPRLTRPANPSSMAPIPRTRPAFGMGGPVAVRPSVAGLAPVPMPRSMRPMNTRPQPRTAPTISPGIYRAAVGVNQSGDYSEGNQFEMANLIASGNSWREAQERKK